MERDNFDRSLRAFQRRVPFQTFTVSLINGDRLSIEHPEALIVRDGVAVYIARGGFPTLFDHESVSQLSAESVSQAG